MTTSHSSWQPSLTPARGWTAMGEWFAMFLLILSIGHAQGQNVTATVPPGHRSQAEQTPTFQTLVNFDGTNGSLPVYGSLVQGSDGYLYGMTDRGGSGGDCGTVFKMTPQGALTTLFSFNGGKNGCHPDGGLMLATDRNIYGSTTDAGNSGVGTLYRVTPSGIGTTVYEFDYYDGANTNSALVESTGGSLWGTTCNGGGNGDGNVFKISPQRVFTVMHSFDFSDGWDPQDATLIQGSDGFFYGETAGGGRFNCPNANGCGTLFRIGSSGKFTVIHDFNGNDGDVPFGGLIQASDGNLYGTTYYGGAYGNGTVFKVDQSNVLTTLYSFAGTDGAQPRGRLIQATDGNLYGTTYAGGTNGDGTIFAITTAGALTTLHNFDGTDGAQSESGLVQATNGVLFGITAAGGTSNDGTIYSLSLGFGPFVSFILNSGSVGQSAKILGQGLSATTAVSFNGTPATFTIVSDNFLTAVVPPGATTGFVTVTTTNGLFTSNTLFRVTP